MFVCPSCLRVFARAVIQESSTPLKRAWKTSRSTEYRPHSAVSSSRRHFASVSARCQDAQAAMMKERSREAEWNPNWRAQKEKEIQKRDLLTELDYLRDPVLLAQSVSQRLQNDAYTQALDLVRVASSRMSCVVSWNHLIDYNMAKGRVQQALKTYQEMKKRAQLPDAYTFTILFRGLASHVEFPKNLERALAIYESMYAPNSPVKPNITHTNAVLTVCAKRADIDTMLGIAARLPGQGPRAADNRTYTLFFNTLKGDLWKTNLEMASHMPKQEGTIDHESIRRRQTATLQGRRMWCDVVERWLRNDIIVDEELVCSFGRLLLLGANSRDPDDILSLVEQAMGIERQIPPLSDPKRKDFVKAIGNHDDVPLFEEPSGTTVENPDPSASSSESLVSTQVQLSSPSPSNPSITQYDESIPAFAPLPSKNKLRIFARPGRNTLSLVMDACIRLRAPVIANKYRILLTDRSGPYKIVPDTENLHTYLRILRQVRSSLRAAKLVEDMIENPPPGDGVTAKTFRIAMSACVRSSQHRDVGVHADMILRLMIQYLEEPDLKTIEMFLAVSNRKGIDWRERIRGLDVLDRIIRNWRSLLSYGRIGSDIANKSAGEVREDSDQEGAENDYGEDESLLWADGSQSSRPKRVRDKVPAFRETLQTSTGRMGERVWRDVRTLVIQVVSICDKAMEQAKQGMGEGQLKDLRRRRWELSAWIAKHDSVRRDKYVARVKNGEIAGLGSRKRKGQADRKQNAEHDDLDLEDFDEDGDLAGSRKR